MQQDEVQQRVKDLLTTLELTDSSKTLAEYSTGMRKRVSFAAAVIHSPDVLFLDEPFESIDPAGVALLKQWLRRFTEQGRTVFITSHVLETVERLCDQVAIITKPESWCGKVTSLCWRTTAPCSPTSASLIRWRSSSCTSLAKNTKISSGCRRCMPKEMFHKRKDREQYLRLTSAAFAGLMLAVSSPRLAL